MNLVFLDESGFAKNWKKSINDQPFHVLGGVLIDSQRYFSASNDVRNAVRELDLGQDHPLGHGFEIKAKDIARGSGYWKNNEEKRNRIRELMLSFPKQYEGTSFLIVIDKMKHINTYPNPDPPHELAFQYMFERVQWRLKELQDEAICVYDQTKFLDDDMHEASMKLMRDGSSVQYVSDFYGYVSKRFKITLIKEFYLGKSDNSIGLQVADFIAAFGYQYFAKGKPDECGWWQTLRDGLYSKPLEGRGLKVFP